MNAGARTARELAWEILQRVEDGAFADALLGHEIQHSKLERRDQALVTRVVYGTIAWQGYLDYLLSTFSRRPLHKLEPPVRTLLRMALFQMTKLTRVPPFAVVDTTVELAKRHRHASAAGLVNAVLRRAAREWRTVPMPSRQENLVEHLSAALSHPAWLVRRWLDELGADATEALLASNNEEAPTVLRANIRRTSREALIDQLRHAGYEAEATTWSPIGVTITPGGFPASIPGHTEGLFSVQGQASQLAVLMLGAQPGDSILDACAAPGGKATAIAERLGDRGRVTALDVSEAGVRHIRNMTRRLGLQNVSAQVADAATWAPSDPAMFDGVLVDAPCTGLGTLRQHPEVRWRRSEGDIQAAADLQRRIITNVARLVRPGGTLVYATCTLAREENDDLIRSFLAASTDFRIDDPRPVLPETVHPLVDADDVLRTWPHRHGLDGFFVVRLKRSDVGGIVKP